MSYRQAMKHRPHPLKVGHTFHSGMSSSPEIRATCSKCGQPAFVRDHESMNENGTTKRPCYACVKEACK